jgi:hypothetical protein
MQATEIQEEEQEDALESLLKKVNLNDPLEVRDYAGNLVEVPRDKFIEYYMPTGATQSEAFHCMQAVRATGLSLLAPGECYFFKTGDGPVRLFTGYMAYLRKGYAAGLEHIETPVLDFGDDPDGYPVSCTITIRIKNREPMTWPTYFSEVAGMAKGSLNKRWAKAPIQMLIKCAIVNILRLSGLVDFTMPYTIDEMPDPVLPGYRTLTEDQLDRWSGAPEKMIDKVELEEASLGEVTAESHQVDMNDFRRSYFKALGARNILQDETERQDIQEEKTGKRHTGDWGPGEYSIMMDWIHTIPIPDPPEESAAQSEGDQVDPFIKEQMEKAKAMGVPKAVTDIIEGTQNATDEADHPDTQEEQEEEQGGGKESTERGGTACEKSTSVRSSRTGKPSKGTYPIRQRYRWIWLTNR